MAVKIFTQEEFEQALPKDYWEYVGLVDGEQAVKVSEHLRMGKPVRKYTIDSKWRK